MTRLPPGAAQILQRLVAAGYEAYLVGGPVRDLLLGRDVADLDFTTNARPAEVQRVFPRSHYPNRFGTVLVQAGGAQHEVTTYRGEGRYSDHRHPDEILFVDRLEDDLQRRDFTINAMAMGIDGAIVDPFGGREDLRRGVIRAVGDPNERLAEDPLRMMRAARLATQLAFSIEPATWEAIVAGAGLLAMISRERVRDELLKILASEHPVTGIDFLDHLGLLPDALPELAAQRRLNRPASERDGAFQHALQTLRCCRGGVLLRLAALLHGLAEVGPHPGPGLYPPQAGLILGEGENSDPAGSAVVPPAPAPEQYAHSPGFHRRSDYPTSPALLPLREKGESTGADALRSAEHPQGRGFVPRRPELSPAADIRLGRTLSGGAAFERELMRLRLSNADADRLRRLVSALPAVSPDLPADDRSARRLLNQFGPLLPDLLDLVEAHRRALAAPAEPQSLDQLAVLRRLVAEAVRSAEPRSLKDLAVTGDDLMRALDLQPGPPLGRLLRELLDRVLDDPMLNERETLLALAQRMQRDDLTGQEPA